MALDSRLLVGCQARPTPARDTDHQTNFDWSYAAIALGLLSSAVVCPPAYTLIMMATLALASVLGRRSDDTDIAGVGFLDGVVRHAEFGPDGEGPIGFVADGGIAFVMSAVKAMARRIRERERAGRIAARRQSRLPSHHARRRR